eukprot:g246.t1
MEASLLPNSFDATSAPATAASSDAIPGIAHATGTATDTVTGTATGTATDTATDTVTDTVTGTVTGTATGGDITVAPPAPSLPAAAMAASNVDKVSASPASREAASTGCLSRCKRMDGGAAGVTAAVAACTGVTGSAGVRAACEAGFKFGRSMACDSWCVAGGGGTMTSVPRISAEDGSMTAARRVVCRHTDENTRTACDNGFVSGFQSYVQGAAEKATLAIAANTEREAVLKDWSDGTLALQDVAVEAQRQAISVLAQVSAAGATLQATRHVAASARDAASTAVKTIQRQRALLLEAEKERKTGGSGSGFGSPLLSGASYAVIADAVTTTRRNATAAAQASNNVSEAVTMLDATLKITQSMAVELVSAQARLRNTLPKIEAAAADAEVERAAAEKKAEEVGKHANTRAESMRKTLSQAAEMEAEASQQRAQAMIQKSQQLQGQVDAAMRKVAQAETSHTDATDALRAIKKAKLTSAIADAEVAVAAAEDALRKAQEASTQVTGQKRAAEDEAAAANKAAALAGTAARQRAEAARAQVQKEVDATVSASRADFVEACRTASAMINRLSSGRAALTAATEAAEKLTSAIERIESARTEVVAGASSVKVDAAATLMTAELAERLGADSAGVSSWLARQRLLLNTVVLDAFGAVFGADAALNISADTFVLALIAIFAVILPLLICLRCCSRAAVPTVDEPAPKRTDAPTITRKKDQVDDPPALQHGVTHDSGVRGESDADNSGITRAWTFDDDAVPASGARSATMTTTPVPLPRLFESQYAKQSFSKRDDAHVLELHGTEPVKLPSKPPGKLMPAAIVAFSADDLSLSAKSPTARGASSAGGALFCKLFASQGIEVLLLPEGARRTLRSATTGDTLDCSNHDERMASAITEFSAALTSCLDGVDENVAQEAIGKRVAVHASHAVYARVLADHKCFQDPKLRLQPRNLIVAGHGSLHVVTCAFVAGMFDRFQGDGEMQWTPWRLLMVTGNLLKDVAAPTYYTLRHSTQQNTSLLLQQSLSALESAVEGTGSWEAFLEVS